jgi:hypothetical protein
MTRLLDHPAIVETVVRYECPKCGNDCQCGVPYVPKTVRAAEAIRANPEKSNRAIADETGLSEPTVRRARASDDAPELERVTGRDGKSYPATKPQTDADEPPRRDLFAEANVLKLKVLDLVALMTNEERNQFRRVLIEEIAELMRTVPPGQEISHF